eukprot:c798_g1_i1.p1 GENE.c798_g1_i1~~c798_g1_i1.p1  ORF type:complete len:295 (+),score=35.06 c798_g1_i1:23-886(+)
MGREELAHYLASLVTEREKLEPMKTLVVQTLRLLDAEISKTQLEIDKSFSETNPSTTNNEHNEFRFSPTQNASTSQSALLLGLSPPGRTIKSETSVADGRIIRKLFVPVELKPSFNFVGRLLGHRGANLQQIEIESGAKVLIRGKGSDKKAIVCKYGDACSRRDSCPYRHKDEPEMPDNDDSKQSAEHLKEPLHVLVIVSADAHGQDCLRIAQSMIEPLLIPEDRMGYQPQFDNRSRFPMYGAPAHPAMSAPYPHPMYGHMRDHHLDDYSHLSYATGPLHPHRYQPY